MRSPPGRSNVSVPEVMWPPPCSTRRINDSAVTDLPDPDSPTMATVSPRPTPNDTPRTACTTRSVLRNSTARSLTASSGVAPERASGHRRACAADLVDGRAHGDRLRIDAQVQQRGSAGIERALQRRGEFAGLRHGFAHCAVRAGERREVGIDQIGTDHAPRVLALLVHADRPVHAVVDDDEDDIRAVLHGGGEFLPVHLEAAVAIP